ncbi:MAG: caspase family protein [Saprospiraceae bacterium]
MTKKALVVGVNDYAPIGTGGPDLNGCVNDALDMANTLVLCGFSPRNIRLLTNYRATRSNILAYLNWLFKNSKSGDSLVFYYSGHGTRVANLNSDYEFDKLDEAICPHDYASAGVIADDTFRVLFQKSLKAGVNLEVIFDCCHSGTGTRVVPGQENLSEGLRARMIEPDAETLFYTFHERELELPSINSRQMVTVKNMKHTLWAGCKDSQLSYESVINGQTRGHFTREFCRVLRATNGNVTRRILDSQVQRALATYRNNQTNQTESSAAEFGQRVFS